MPSRAAPRCVASRNRTLCGLICVDWFIHLDFRLKCSTHTAEQRPRTQTKQNERTERNRNIKSEEHALSHRTHLMLLSSLSFNVRCMREYISNAAFGANEKNALVWNQLKHRAFRSRQICILVSSNEHFLFVSIALLLRSERFIRSLAGTQTAAVGILSLDWLRCSHWTPPFFYFSFAALNELKRSLLPSPSGSFIILISGR